MTDDDWRVSLLPTWKAIARGADVRAVPGAHTPRTQTYIHGRRRRQETTDAATGRAETGQAQSGRGPHCDTDTACTRTHTCRHTYTHTHTYGPAGRGGAATSRTKQDTFDISRASITILQGRVRFRRDSGLATPDSRGLDSPRSRVGPHRVASRPGPVLIARTAAGALCESAAGRWPVRSSDCAGGHQRRWRRSTATRPSSLSTRARPPVIVRDRAPPP